jgi:hypothetical protein
MITFMAKEKFYVVWLIVRLLVAPTQIEFTLRKYCPRFRLYSRRAQTKSLKNKTLFQRVRTPPV